jgi:hypothetical protein
MTSWLKRCAYSALPVVGILSLVCGPSPSAAYAVTCDKHSRRQVPAHTAGQDAKQQRVAKTLPDAGWPGELGGLPRPRPSQQPKPKVLSFFVAPRAAKPSETKTTDLTPATAASNPFSPQFRVIQAGSTCEQSQPAGTLHRPAYLAQGPP